MNKKSPRTWKMTLTTPPSDAGSKLPYWEIIAGSDGQPGEVVSITEDLPKPSMAFEEAYSLVMGIHEQCGDHISWNNLKLELREEVERHESYEKWQLSLPSRRDLSDDMKDMLRDMDASIEVVFKLMGKDQ